MYRRNLVFLTRAVVRMSEGRQKWHFLGGGGGVKEIDKEFPTIYTSSMHLSYLPRKTCLILI